MCIVNCELCNAKALFVSIKLAFFYNILSNLFATFKFSSTPMAYCVKHIHCTNLNFVDGESIIIGVLFASYLFRKRDLHVECVALNICHMLEGAKNDCFLKFDTKNID